jgi:soluble lytic murein transglycosylase
MLSKLQICRFFFFSLVFLVSACRPPRVKSPHPVAMPPVQNIETKPKPEQDDFINLLDLNPYFVEVFGKEAALALSEDRLSEAIELFDEIAANTSDIVLTPRARFLAAYLAERIGDDERALNELPELAKELPLLANIAVERASYAALRLGKCDRAIELAASVDGDSTSAPDATMLHADALRSLDRLDEAADVYKTYLEKWPSGNRVGEALSRIVECLSQLIKRKQKEAASEALEYLDKLKTQSPTGRWTEAASTFENEIYEALGRKMPQSPRERKTAVVAYEKAVELMQKMKNRQAERGFDKVLNLARRNGGLFCSASYNRAMVVLRLRDRGRAAQMFKETADKCDAPDIRVKALYNSAKAHQSVENYNDAVQLFGEVEAEYSTHSYADDARLHAAECLLALGDREEFKEKLESLPDLYPSGDMRAEALWTLAHENLKRNELIDAKQVLDRYYRLFPNERGWYAAGRSGYWLGRVEEMLGDVGAAASRYEQVLAGSPLTFYMVLAYNRLAAIDEKRAQSLIADLAAENGETEARFPKSLIDRFPGLALGIELNRLGLVTLSKREFDKLLKQPNLPPEIFWLTAAVLRREGRYSEARETADRAESGWKRRYPVNQDYLHWSLAYPTAFDQEVNEAAAGNGVHSALIWAVMREESGFNPDVESWANAIGLMQLILPTARRVGKGLEIQVTPRTLRQPSVNIKLGTAYLARLMEMFDNHAALAVAGYNAGEGAVARWLKERPGCDLDIFVEEIPYDQTRGYTKRVIASYATYLFLYGEDRSVLKLDLTLPARGGAN